VTFLSPLATARRTWSFATRLEAKRVQFACARMRGRLPVVTAVHQLTRDDLVTIHRCLREGLGLWEGGQIWPASVHWCHSQRTTWGRPLVLSMMALHFRIKERYLR
jgi:hypothetical protein